MRDLELNSLGSVTLSVESAGAVTLERLKLTGGVGMSVEGPVTVRDISITASGTAIQLLSGASLVLERAVLRGGQRGIESTLGVTVDISNTVIADTSNIAVDLANATGAMRFVTITNSGNSSSGASGLACNVYYPPGLSVTSTIVWTPNTSKPPISGMCRLSSTIAGPIGVVGASNIDPMFTAQDWHLSPNSPARDMATTGPALDFEGDPRPNGTGFDIGADETR
ncbi:MAG: choice-of-anchor Q domain-containing protein [Kofleriaceae bacterium]